MRHWVKIWEREGSVMVVFDGIKRATRWGRRADKDIRIGWKENKSRGEIFQEDELIKAKERIKAISSEVL